ncbi:hypothetical protein QL285_002764 [Trifolium repens]|nr:hypothetical protein QL285_002764 [Trifolium repens]
MLVGKGKVNGVDVASCTNQSNFENEKSDQEVYDSCLTFLCFDFMSGGSIVEFLATILVHQEYYKLYSTCNDLNGIVSSLHLIRDQAQKDEQKKNEDTISSVVASEIKSMIEDQI